jgi:hypothetical protein
MGQHADDAMYYWIDKQFGDTLYGGKGSSGKSIYSRLYRDGGTCVKPHKGRGGWKVGDVVKLLRGTSPAVVTEVDSEGYILSRRYIGSPRNSSLINTNNTFEKFDQELTEHQQKLIENHLGKLNQGETIMAKDTLYEIKEGTATRFATKLAINSSGQWVMEEKGTGIIFTVDKTNAEEVMPYTVSVKFADGSRTYSYFAAKDQYEKGSFYFMDSPSGWSIVKVTDVNTKSRAAAKELVVMGKLSLDTSMIKD